MLAFYTGVSYKILPSDYESLYLLYQVYDQGRMSKHMDELAIGDKLLFKGPRGRFKYTRNAKRHLGAHQLGCDHGRRYAS